MSEYIAISAAEVANRLAVTELVEEYSHGVIVEIQGRCLAPIGHSAEAYHFYLHDRDFSFRFLC